MKQVLGYHDYSVESFARLTGWKLNVIEGVMTDECVALYRNSGIALTRG
jgi:tRNA(adenine34) deaminase